MLDENCIAMPNQNTGFDKHVRIYKKVHFITLGYYHNKRLHMDRTIQVNSLP
uniref:Uncharacterized protein n=1 Tax=Anguilla anguilla TaxID=7936 RepID=A0A0E9XIS5_ANGAN